jgi:predicted transcriptional regulator
MSAPSMSDKADKRFAKIPMSVATMPGLAGCEFRVLIVLVSLANHERLAWPSLNTIAKLTGTTVSKVSLAITKLEAAGLLRRHRRQSEYGDYDSTLYELFPDGMGVLPCGGVPTPREGRTVLPPAAVRTPRVPLEERTEDSESEESESVAAREALEKIETDSFGRDAPFAQVELTSANVVKFSDGVGPKLKAQKKELRRQKVMRFINAKYSGEEQWRRMNGMCGGDQVRDEQWWFDKCDAERIVAGWDDVRDRRRSWQRLG